MSTRAVTMITKRYPDDHLFDLTKTSCAKRRVHKILTLCEVLLTRYMYLTSVWCHVFHKRYHVNPACVYYCSIRVVLKKNDSMTYKHFLATAPINSIPPNLGGGLFVLTQR